MKESLIQGYDRMREILAIGAVAAAASFGIAETANANSDPVNLGGCKVVQEGYAPGQTGTFGLTQDAKGNYHGAYGKNPNATGAWGC